MNMDNEKRQLTRFSELAPVTKVDDELGIIYGVSLITANREAAGHEVYVDETMVDQVVEFGAKTEPTGLKSRFDHPSACSRAVGSFVGRFHNIRRDGMQARGDLHLAESAAKSPEGDLRGYILSLAKEDPDAFATSIVFRNADPEVVGYGDDVPADDPRRFPHARVAALHHCDIVDQGAANDGLFGRGDYWQEQVERWGIENMPTFNKLMDHWQKWKTKKEKAKMSEEMKQEIESLTAERDVLVVEMAEMSESHDVALTELKEEYEDAGRDEVHGLIKARMDKYDNKAEFVMSTIQLTEAECDAEYIKALKVEKDVLEVELDGEPELAAEADEDALNPLKEEEVATFTSKVDALKETGIAGSKAMEMAIKEFPELYKAHRASL